MGRDKAVKSQQSSFHSSIAFLSSIVKPYYQSCFAILWKLNTAFDLFYKNIYKFKSQ